MCRYTLPVVCLCLHCHQNEAPLVNRNSLRKPNLRFSALMLADCLVCVGADNDRLVPRASRDRAHHADPPPLPSRQTQHRPSQVDQRRTGPIHRVSTLLMLCMDIYRPAMGKIKSLIFNVNATPNFNTFLYTCDHSGFGR